MLPRDVLADEACRREIALDKRGIGPDEHGRPRTDAFLGQAVMHVGGRQNSPRLR
jgi:hypothetical protein